VSWHNDGFGSAYTAKRRPVTLAFSEEQPTLAAALSRERQIKRWSALKKEALIAGDLKALKSLSKRRRPKKCSGLSNDAPGAT